MSDQDDPTPDELTSDEPVTDDGPSRAQRIGRGVAGFLLAALLGIVGAGVGLAAWGPVRADVGALRMGISIAPATTGESVVDLSPLGAVKFDTHDTPLRFRASIDDFESSAARKAARTGKLPDTKEIQDAAPKALGFAGGTILLVAAGSGALLAGLVRRRWSAVAVGAVAPVLVLGGVIYASWKSFDLQTADPSCTGAIGLACEGVARVRETVNNKDTQTTEIGAAAKNLANFYIGAVGNDQETKDSTYRILLTSDIHLNPSALGFAANLAEAFDVNAVVNVGDDADWGGAVGNITGGAKEFDVPFIWVRGNHDSLVTQRDSKNNGAVVLDDSSFVQDGFNYWGIGDPTFTPKADKTVVRLGEKQYKQKWSKDVLAPAVGKLPAQPDIIAVHDPAMLDALTTRPTLTLTGHTHKFKATTGRNPDGTPWAVVTNGSTGGAGLRVLDTGQERPMQACIIWLDKETKDPQFLDLFSFRPLVDSTYSAERVSLLPPS
jgi:predicted phosphodiesterase